MSANSFRHVIQKNGKSYGRYAKSWNQVSYKGIPDGERDWEYRP